MQPAAAAADIHTAYTMAPAASVLSAPFIMQSSQHCSIARSCGVYLHMLLVANSSMKYGTCSPACMYKSSLTSSFICIPCKDAVVASACWEGCQYLLPCSAGSAGVSLMLLIMLLLLLIPHNSIADTIPCAPTVLRSKCRGQQQVVSNKVVVSNNHLWLARTTVAEPCTMTSS